MPTGKGAANPNWRGGRVTDPRGYVLIRVGKDHPLADVRGYAYEHRLNAEAARGAPLRPGEEVHHETLQHGDNAPDQLKIARDRAEHQSWHRQRTDLRPYGGDNPVVACECGCGQTFNRYDSENRPRRFVSGHNIRPRSN